MTGLVEQLQADALDQSIPVSTLLGKVKICAAKLGLDDALEWVDHELNGYFKVHADTLPDYRKGHGTPKAQDQFGNWRPIQISDEWLEANLSETFLREPVSNYEELLRHESRVFEMPIDTGIANTLADAYNLPITAMRNTIPRGIIHGVVQKVRNMTLDWGLELSRAGIHGEGLSFTASEREKATVSNITIGALHGNFNTGNASGAGAQINQQAHLSNDLPAIRDLIAAVQSQVQDVAARSAMVAAAQEIANARSKPSLLAGYERLVSAAANHMSVIAPFLPALGTMLAS
ncbi:MAG: hypothetical protein J7530_07425 [Novosphingobium sp.]|nr:hypothetical protein [Novosphingobium sp.]